MTCILEKKQKNISAIKQLNTGTCDWYRHVGNRIVLDSGHWPNGMKIRRPHAACNGRGVLEWCVWTDRQTDRHTHHNTVHRSRERSNYRWRLSLLCWEVKAKASQAERQIRQIPRVVQLSGRPAWRQCVRPVSIQRAGVERATFPRRTDS